MPIWFTEPAGLSGLAAQAIEEPRLRGEMKLFSVWIGCAGDRWHDLGRIILPGRPGRQAAATNRAVGHVCANDRETMGTKGIWPPGKYMKPHQLLDLIPEAAHNKPLEMEA